MSKRNHLRLDTCKWKFAPALYTCKAIGCGMGVAGRGAMATTNASDPGTTTSLGAGTDAATDMSMYRGSGMPKLKFETIADMVGTEDMTKGVEVRSFAITANVA